MKAKKGDIIVILIILIVAIILYLIFNSKISNGSQAIIKINNKIYKMIDLNNETIKEETIKFKDSGYMTLKYDKTGIYVSDVTCPDRICQKSGKINKSNQSIVCLPNKTIIYIDYVSN